MHAVFKFVSKRILNLDFFSKTSAKIIINTFLGYLSVILIICFIRDFRIELGPLLRDGYIGTVHVNRCNLVT